MDFSMREIIIAIVSIVFGAAFVKLASKVARAKKINNVISKNIMCENESLQQGEQNEDSVSNLSNAEESRPASVAIIYRSELDYISRCILDYPNIETGGQLFGFWTNDGVPVVLYAIGPGKNAQHNPTSFFQDMVYLNSIGERLYSNYRLQHIGEWHSHHQLGMSYPSRGDVDTMLVGVSTPGFPRMLLCIGNYVQGSTMVNAFNFNQNSLHNYIHANWTIVNQISPYRHLLDQELKVMLIHPKSQCALWNKEMSKLIDNVKIHWLTKNVENVETMKIFVSMIKEKFPRYEILTEILDSGEPMITIKEADLCIVFPYDFPQNSPIIRKENGIITSNSCAWEIEDSLVSAFERWIADALPIQINDDVPPANSANMESTETDV